MGTSQSKLLAPRGASACMAIFYTYIGTRAIKHIRVLAKHHELKNELELKNLYDDLKLMFYAYCIDFIFALGGKSTLWNWEPKHIIQHHSVGMVSVLLILLYDKWMCSRHPHRWKYKTLRGVSKSVIAGLLSCFNEGFYAILSLYPKHPDNRLRIIQRVVSGLTLIQFTLTDFLVYYAFFVRRLVWRDPSLEIGEVVFVQVNIIIAMLHLKYLTGLLQKLLQQKKVVA